MKRFVGFWIVLLLVALAAAWTVGCRDDITVPFPPSLKSDYTGFYSFLEIGPLGDTITDTSQLITFRFTDDDYTMVMDTSIAESLRVFCDNRGLYTLGDGVTITLEEPNFTRGVCTEDWDPDGFFGLDQTTDTVRLLQDLSDPTTGRKRRLLRLFPVPR